MFHFIRITYFVFIYFSYFKWFRVKKSSHVEYYFMSSFISFNYCASNIVLLSVVFSIRSYVFCLVCRFIYVWAFIYLFSVHFCVCYFFCLHRPNLVYCPTVPKPAKAPPLCLAQVIKPNPA